MFTEPADLAWEKRFGESAPADASGIEGFLRHRCIRHYSGREVPESTVAALIGAAQSAATSSSLQLWSVISVQTPGLREQVTAVADDQPQVRNAPWFFAWIADLHRIDAVARKTGEGAESLDYTEYEIMALIDVSLAAERFVCAAEAMGLGICYIGAMRNDPYRIREILNLPPLSFCPFGLCLGWPIENSTADIKPRLNPEAVWHREIYREADVTEFDDRMRSFYEAQKMKGDVTWSMRSSRRLSKLTGREVLKPFLDEQGFGKR